MRTSAPSGYCCEAGARAYPEPCPWHPPRYERGALVQDLLGYDGWVSRVTPSGYEVTYEDSRRGTVFLRDGELQPRLPPTPVDSGA